MTLVSIKEINDNKIKVGDFFYFEDKLYLVVDTENFNNRNTVNIIDVSTGQGIYSNDLERFFEEPNMKNLTTLNETLKNRNLTFSPLREVEITIK